MVIIILKFNRSRGIVMKPELQRITATLDKLNQEYHTKEIAPSFTVNRENMNKTKDKSLTFSLPKIKPIPLTNHHNTPNPALARNILKEIDSKIAIWEQKSHQIQQEIQELYLEGPIVDGWLESQVQSFDTNTPVHSTSEQVIVYVDLMKVADFGLEFVRRKKLPN